MPASEGVAGMFISSSCILGVIRGALRNALGAGMQLDDMNMPATPSLAGIARQPRYYRDQIILQ